MISTIITLALGVGGFMFLRTQLRSLTDQSAGVDAMEGARAALDFMSNDIRMTRANGAAGSGWVGTSTCTGRSDSFTAVWDDGLSANGTAPNHTVQYWYDSANKRIVRTTGGADTTLIPNVPANGLAFTYYTSTGAAAAMSGTPSQVTSCDGVQVVQVSVTVTAKRATQTFTRNIGTRIALRNRSNVLYRMHS